MWRFFYGARSSTGWYVALRWPAGLRLRYDSSPQFGRHSLSVSWDS